MKKPIERSYSKATWKKIRDKYKKGGRICPICGKHESEFRRYVLCRNWSVDHIIPISKGGTNEPDNLRIICLHCNFSRGNRT